MIWHNLTHLDLSNNQVNKIDSSIFTLAPNLQYLDLSCNNLGQDFISKDTFTSKNGSNLVHLDLSNNPKIGRIKYKIRSLVNLKTLLLSNTGIDDLEFLTGDLVELKLLDCSNCNFSEYQMIERLSVLENLQEVRFFNNSIECNQYDYWVFRGQKN